MTKRIYMLTWGMYDDYRVRGLYEAFVDISEEDMTDFAVDMVMEQFPEIDREYAAKAIVTGDAYKRDDVIAAHYIGDAPAYDVEKDDWKLWLEWKNKQGELFKGKNMDLLDFLVRKGLLFPIKHEEIHLDEAWTPQDLI